MECNTEKAPVPVPVPVPQVSFHRHLHDCEEALEEHTRAIESDPQNSEAYFQRALEKAALGRYEEAISDHDRALVLSPGNPEAYMRRGSAKSILGRLDSALEDHEQAVRLSPLDAETHAHRGATKAQLGRHEDAIADFDHALNLMSDNPQYYSMRGSSLAHLHRYEEAIADYDSAIRLYPEDALAYQGRGAYKGELGLYEEAIADFDNAIRLNPADPDSLRNREMAAVRYERYGSSVADLNEAIRLNPQSADAFYQRGLTRANLGNYGAAIVDINEAIKLEPNHADAHHVRGFARLQLKDYRGAVADLDEAIRLNPDDALYYHNRAAAKQGLAKNSDIESNPLFVRTYDHPAWAEGQLKAFEEAIADLGRSIELNPQFAAAYSGRGWCLGQLGRGERAIADLDKALELEPDQQMKYFNRGYALGSLGRHEDAVRDFNEVIRLNPNSADSFFHRGYALQSLGRREHAQGDFREAVRLNPNLSAALNSLQAKWVTPTDEATRGTEIPSPTTGTRIPIALMGLGLGFRVGTFLLWPLILLGILALCGLVAWGAVESGRYLILLYLLPILGIGCYICLQAAVLTLRSSGSADLAVIASPSEHPGLWALAEQSADAVGAAPPDNIIVGMSANFYVTESPVLLFGQSAVVKGRTLYVSAPLLILRLMSEMEIKAVLAHEFAHFTGRDTTYSTQIAPVYTSLTNGISAIKSEMSWSLKGLVLALPLVIATSYHWLFRILDSAISRRRELRCDEIASQVFGKDHIGAGLIKVVGYGTLLSENIDGHFITLLNENRTYRNYPEWFTQFIADESVYSRVSGIVNYLANAKTQSSDSHPALSERLKALDASSLIESGIVAPYYSFHHSFCSEQIEARLTTLYTQRIQNYMSTYAITGAAPLR